MLPVREASAGAGADPQSPAAASCRGASIIERVWHEHTSAQASCQIVPVDVASDATVQSTALDRDATGVTALSLRVLSDREKAQGVNGPASLGGKAYVVRVASPGVDVRDAAGAAPPPEEQARVSALAATALGWPGAAVAARPLATGAQAPALAAAVQRLVQPTLHGESAAEVTTTVRFAASRNDGRRAVLVFDVTLSATTSDAGMCHRWTLSATLSGQLVLSAADGAFESLRLHGPRRDTQSVCPDVAPNGGGAGPLTCNEGEARLLLVQTCASS